MKTQYEKGKFERSVFYEGEMREENNFSQKIDANNKLIKIAIKFFGALGLTSKLDESHKTFLNDANFVIAHIDGI